MAYFAAALLMATVNFTGFDSGVIAELLSSAGTVSVQNTTARNGYALRVNPATTGTGSGTLSGVLATGVASNSAASVVTSWVRFYFRFATAPASADEEFFLVAQTAAASVKMALRLNSAGNVAAYDSTATLMATGSTVLSANVWYRIEVKCGTGASGAWEVKVNGTSEVSGTGSLRTSNAGVLLFGKPTNRNGNTVDFFYDDCLWSDSAYPGAGQCAILVPTGNGNYAGAWAATGAATLWQAVAEVPNDGDTSYISTSTGTDPYTAALTDSGAAGVSGTVNCVKVLNLSKNAAGTSTLNTRFRSGSTDSDTTAATLTGGYAAYQKLSDTDPATSAAWAVSAIDGVESGVVNATGGSTARVTAVYAMADFAPSAGGPAPHYTRRRLLGGTVGMGE